MKDRLIRGENVDYKRIYYAKTQVRLHRHLMERHIGRKLHSDEVVHHKDGNKFNNAIENLEVVSKAEHMKIHAVGMKTRFKKKYKIKRVDIVQLYQQEMKPIHIVAKILNTSYGTILRRMGQFKIPRRKQGQIAG